MTLMEAIITLGQARRLEPGQTAQITAGDKRTVLLTLDEEVWRDMVRSFDRAVAVELAARSLIAVAEARALAPAKGEPPPKPEQPAEHPF